MKMHTHDEAMEAIIGCSQTVTRLSYEEAISTYLALRGLRVPNASTLPVERGVLEEVREALSGVSESFNSGKYDQFGRFRPTKAQGEQMWFAVSKALAKIDLILEKKNG